MTKGPACELIGAINRFLTVDGFRRDISILCGRNSLHNLLDPKRHDLWMALARTILVDFYNVHASPCSFTSIGRAGNFLICLWQFVQENFYPLNVIASNYSITNSGPLTQIPQFFLNAAHDLELPVNNNHQVEHQDMEVEEIIEEHLEENGEEEGNDEADIQDADEAGDNNVEGANENGSDNFEENADEIGSNNFPDAYEAGADNFPDADVVGDNNILEADMVGANNMPPLIPGQNELYVDLFNRRWANIFANITEDAVRDAQNNSLFVELLLTRVNTLGTALIASVPRGLVQRELDVLNTATPEGIFNFV